MFRRGYNFITRVSNGSILQSSSVLPKEIEKVGYQKPDITKVLINKALKDKSLSEVVVNLESDEFRSRADQK